MGQRGLFIFWNGLKNSPLTCDSIAAKSDSPADIHGMWYPTIRRTLMCLSKIYRSVEKAIFQEVSETYFYFSVFFWLPFFRIWNNFLQFNHYLVKLPFRVKSLFTIKSCFTKAIVLQLNHYCLQLIIIYIYTIIYSLPKSLFLGGPWSSQSLHWFRGSCFQHDQIT